MQWTNCFCHKILKYLVHISILIKSYELFDFQYSFNILSFWYSTLPWHKWLPRSKTSKDSGFRNNFYGVLRYVYVETFFCGRLMTVTGKFQFSTGRLAQSTNRQSEFSSHSHESPTKKSQCKRTFMWPVA